MAVELISLKHEQSKVRALGPIIATDVEEGEIEDSASTAVVESHDSASIASTPKELDVSLPLDELEHMEEAKQVQELSSASAEEQVQESNAEVLPVERGVNTPRPLLSSEQLDQAKSVVLDLLGWGVPPEYLLHCGVSASAVYRIFTDLHLRLPSNMPEPSKSFQL